MEEGRNTKTKIGAADVNNTHNEIQYQDVNLGECLTCNHDSRVNAGKKQAKSASSKSQSELQVNHTQLGYNHSNRKAYTLSV
jgi:hypothetical protein